VKVRIEVTLSAIYVVISQSVIVVTFLSFVIGQNVDINKAFHLLSP
jgi:hypothetical protein